MYLAAVRFGTLSNTSVIMRPLIEHLHLHPDISITDLQQFATQDVPSDQIVFRSSLAYAAW